MVPHLVRHESRTAQSDIIGDRIWGLNIQIALIVHCVLFALALLSPLAVIFWRVSDCENRRNRVKSAVLPFVIIGVCSAFLVQIAGRPVFEWLIPGLACLIIAFFARGQVVYKTLNRLLIVVALVLSVNFLILVNSGEYTTNEKAMTNLFETQKHAMISVAEKEINNTFPDIKAVPKGYVSDIIGKAGYFECDLYSFEAEWHTKITRLLHIEKRKGRVWYAGDGHFEIVPQ